MKRTPENCTIADREYDRDDPMRYENWECAGVRQNGDEPIEVCQNCKFCASYEE